MYKEMADILKEGSIGNFNLTKFAITDKDVVAKMRQGISNGTYMMLRNGDETLMSDTDMEKRTNRSFVRNAHGDVLIGGLGIGMIVVAIQDKPEVKSITVLEKSPEIIELVGKQLPVNEKVTIIEADVYKWKPEQKFNCIYMDIWPYINSDVYKYEMVPLTRKYGHYLVTKEEDPNRINDCWCKREAKNNTRI